MAKHEHDPADDHESNGLTLAVPRSRGALSGLILMALGAWGALLPLLGPHFHFGYGQDNDTFNFTEARFWLQILPGVVAFVAGLFILLGGNRLTGTFFAYLAVAAGAWFVVGPILADLRTSGYVGAPIGSSDRQHLDAIAAFYGLGAVIIFFATFIAGRLSVVGVRDVRAKDHRHGGQDEAVAETPAFPATREVPVTTTHVRPVEAPPVVSSSAAADTVVTLPADSSERGLGSHSDTGAVLDADAGR